MSAGDELIEFITARLDEDEAVARRNIGRAPGTTTGLGDTEEGGPSFPDYQTYDGEDIDAANDYLDRFRPLRMLREVEVKRAILAEHAPASGRTICRVCWTDGDQYPCSTVQHLAEIWSDHVDYRQEWAP